MTEKRKTINGEDIIKGMRDLNFEQYIDNIDFYNEKYKRAIKKSETEKPGGVPDPSSDKDDEE